MAEVVEKYYLIVTKRAGTFEYQEKSFKAVLNKYIENDVGYDYFKLTKEDWEATSENFTGKTNIGESENYGRVTLFNALCKIDKYKITKVIYGYGEVYPENRLDDFIQST